MQVAPRRRPGLPSNPAVDQIPDSNHKGALEHKVCGCFRFALAKLASTAVWPTSADQPVRRPDSILKNEPREKLDLWRCPDLSNQRRHLGFDQSGKLHRVCCGGGVASISHELPSDFVLHARDQLNIKGLAPKIVKLLDEGDRETALQVDVSNPIIIVQGLGDTAIGALGEGENAWGNVLWFLTI